MKLVNAGLVFMTILIILSVSMFAQDQPKVFLSSSDMHCSSFSLECSGSSTTQASVEMVGKFQNDCPTAQIVSTAQESDYIVSLNRSRVNLFPFNQFSVVNHNGDALNFHSGMTGSVRGNIKRACKTVMEDWKQKGRTTIQAAKPAVRSGPSSGSDPALTPAAQFWASSTSLGATLANSKEGGVEITGFLPNGPIQAAGLHVGDVIRAVDLKPVKTAEDFRQTVVDRAPGATIRISYVFLQSNLWWVQKEVNVSLPK
jgi:hypothetical protein